MIRTEIGSERELVAAAQADDLSAFNEPAGCW